MLNVIYFTNLIFQNWVNYEHDNFKTPANKVHS